MIVGKTRTQGWEIGVRRTFPLGVDEAWDLLMSESGLTVWFGRHDKLPFKEDAEFKTREGTSGKIVSFYDGEMVRMRWRLKDWAFDSTLQVRAMRPKNAAKDKAVISFHHEKLQTRKQREQMKQHWSAVLDKLEGLIEKTQSAASR